MNLPPQMQSWLHSIASKLKNKEWIRTVLKRRSFRRAVKSANHLRAMYHKKYVVIFWRGEFKPVQKHLLKEMWKNKQFKQGLNWAAIQKMVVFETN